MSKNKIINVITKFRLRSNIITVAKLRAWCSVHPLQLQQSENDRCTTLHLQCTCYYCIAGCVIRSRELKSSCYYDLYLYDGRWFDRLIILLIVQLMIYVHNNIIVAAIVRLFRI